MDDRSLKDELWRKELREMYGAEDLYDGPAPCSTKIWALMQKLGFVRGVKGDPRPTNVDTDEK